MPILLVVNKINDLIYIVIVKYKLSVRGLNMELIWVGSKTK